ncbi:hypothetical protein GCM10010300_33590 [Streptomyces olivaceoviridis]|uniref:MerR family transcriptional regulator n=1 Tax=Streptomyces olivaceoviridis TaxID=1921 RepID=UPI001677EBF1|nr:MerR family transcriptional regulator [Streptomyces olivaceoviridis]GGY86592.1 hypothetical protein GCM10010300_33590 [Streptomyces olivaceoviridis]
MSSNVPPGRPLLTGGRIRAGIDATTETRRSAGWGAVPRSAFRPQAEPDPGLTIAEAARRTGVSVHTLRYCERVGLVITEVDRTPGGRRRYHQRDLTWITLCTKLRATGMPIRTIRRYAELVAAGDAGQLWVPLPKTQAG